jgi:hypothetical protein
MKYEAKALNWIAWPSANWVTYNTHDYNAVDTLASNATDRPIATISQANAIKICKDAWYHLITNNEWMTVARDIEQQANNWSSNTVWSGYLYSWHNDNWPSNTLTASTNDLTWYINTWDSTLSPWDSAYNNFSSNIEQAYKWQKRTLTLSNWNVIWDLAWNVWEHVNWANTIDWTNHSTFKWNWCNTWADWWNSFGSGDWTQCGFINWYTYNNNWPKTPNLNASNGIWRIWSYSSASTLTDRIFFRGGAWTEGAYAGIFTLNFSWASYSSDFYVGFRCAK